MLKKIIIGLLMTVGVHACSKEGRLTPSCLDKNWYAIENKPGNLNQLLYKIYKEYDCSVFYKDTIGKEYRGLDGNGDSIIYYETLKIGYFISGKSNIHYTLTDRKDRLMAGAKILYESILPELKKRKLIPRSILLTDTIRLEERANKAWYVKKTMTGLLLGSVIEKAEGDYLNIEDMTEIQKKEVKGRIMASMFLENLMNTEFEYLDKEFLSIITEETGVEFIYERSYYDNNEEYHKPVEELGFITWGYSVKKKGFTGTWLIYKKTVSKKQDIEDFMAVVLGIEEDAFSQRYKEFPIVMKKYRWMKNFLKEKKILE